MHRNASLCYQFSIFLSASSSVYISRPLLSASNIYFTIMANSSLFFWYDKLCSIKFLFSLANFHFFISARFSSWVMADILVCISNSSSLSSTWNWLSYWSRFLAFSSNALTLCCNSLFCCYRLLMSSEYDWSYLSWVTLRYESAYFWTMSLSTASPF